MSDEAEPCTFSAEHKGAPQFREVVAAPDTTSFSAETFNLVDTGSVGVRFG
jgi:hypothetical protein